MPRVLIVDENAQTSQRLASRVRSLGYETSVVNSAELAVQEMQGGDVSVMVADLRSSRRRGVDMVRLAKQVSPNTRSVLVGPRETTAREYKAALEQGAVDVLTDSRSDADLGLALRKAVDCGDGVLGSVHGLSLIDLLQVIHHARRSLTLRVGPDVGEIHLLEGEIVHAAAVPRGVGLGSLSGPLMHGRAALKVLLQATGGVLSTSALPDDGPRTVTDSFQPLLLDLLRQIDERKRGDPTPPSPYENDAPAAPLAPHRVAAPLRDAPAARRAIWPILVGAFAITVVFGALLLLWLVDGCVLPGSASGNDRAAPTAEIGAAAAPMPVAEPLAPEAAPAARVELRRSAPAGRNLQRAIRSRPQSKRRSKARASRRKERAPRELQRSATPSAAVTAPRPAMPSAAAPVVAPVAPVTPVANTPTVKVRAEVKARNKPRIGTVSGTKPAVGILD